MQKLEKVGCGRHFPFMVGIGEEQLPRKMFCSWTLTSTFPKWPPLVLLLFLELTASLSNCCTLPFLIKLSDKSFCDNNSSRPLRATLKLGRQHILIFQFPSTIDILIAVLFLDLSMISTVTINDTPRLILLNILFWLIDFYLKLCIILSN